MYINFGKARYWVRQDSLVSYLIWRCVEAMSSQQIIKDLLRTVWAPSWHLRLNNELGDIEKKARGLGVQTGWIRSPTDGARVQVFDNKCKKICKVAKKDAAFSTIQAEIEVRSHLPTLAPAILKVSDDSSAFVEEWLPGKSVPYSVDILSEVVNKLRKCLYKIDYFNFTKYRQLLETYGVFTKQVKDVLNFAVSSFQERSLPVSQVHGDLVCKNIWQTPKRGLLLLDWEYSRKCLATYDCWLYHYDFYRSQNYSSPLTSDFFSALGTAFVELGYNLSARDVELYHLLHLIERHVFLSHVTPEQSAFIRQVMEKDMGTIKLRRR